MERTKFNQPSVVITVKGKAFMKAGDLIVRFQLNEKTLRQLYKEEKKRTLLAPKKSKPTKEVRNNEYLPLAKQLSEIIQTKKNIKHTLPQIKQWSDEIRKLSEGNDIDYDRIENTLDWYEKNIGGEYVPIVESGYSLKSKFIRLEAAMEREKNPYQDRNKPKEKSYDNMTYHLCPDGKYRNKAGAIYVE